MNTANKPIKSPGIHPAIYWYARGCAKGDAAACNEAGWATYKGSGVKASDVKAVQFYKKACGELPVKNAYGCGNLGWHLSNGRGVDIDHVASAAAYAFACENGLSASCFSLGIAFERGRGVDKDETYARKLYAQTCEKGYPKACGNLGVLQLSGIGGPVDFPNAIRHLAEQCEKNNNPWACGTLGYAYSNGTGLKKIVVRVKPSTKNPAQSIRIHSAAPTLAILFMLEVAARKIIRSL